jgi:hypothetical protein
MIETVELRRMAEARQADAIVLHRAGRYDAAMYLCGYAIELVLKARICDTLGWIEFPSERKDFQGLQSFQTHDLGRLLHLSGREESILHDFSNEWKTVSTWKSEWRYLPVGITNQTQCIEMLGAVAIIREAT